MRKPTTDRLNRTLKDLEGTMNLADWHHRDVKRQLLRVQRALQMVADHGDDQVVLACTRGAGRATEYHNGARPCGRATRTDKVEANWETLLEAEAIERRLHRCTACRWPTTRGRAT